MFAEGRDKICDPSKGSIGTGTSGRRVGLPCSSCSSSLLRFRDRSGDGDGGAPYPTWATPKNEDMLRLDGEFLKGTNARHVIQRVEVPNLPLLRSRSWVGVEAKTNTSATHHPPLPYVLLLSRLWTRCLTGVVVSCSTSSTMILFM
jgi:hypothetical protein